MFQLVYAHLHRAVRFGSDAYEIAVSLTPGTAAVSELGYNRSLRQTRPLAHEHLDTVIKSLKIEFFQILFSEMKIEMLLRNLFLVT